MEILAESRNYTVFSDFETVLVKNRESGSTTVIGDFYGYPQLAIISDNEEVCIMSGCGIIIYYLNEPFETYEYNKKTSQWKEWGREKGNESWVEDMKYIDDNLIEIQLENGESVMLEIR